MKKLSFFSLAVAGLLLGSCSNDEILDGGNPGGDGTTAGAMRAGYINLGINLPTTPAAAKDDPNAGLDDGTPGEYAVNNAVLVVFEKAADAAESTATFRAAYDLTNLRPWEGEGTSTDQVTTKANMVAEVPAKTLETNTLYALVMLNSANLFDVDENNQLKAKANINEGAYSRTISTFADLTNTAMSLSSTLTDGGAGNAAIDENVGFFMTNAPLLYNGAVVTLAKIDDNSIFQSEAQAAAAPATQIYVERAQSKVTLDVYRNFNGTIVDADPNDQTTNIYAGDSIEILSWGLDITNRSFYPVRKMAAATGETYEDFDDWYLYPNYGQNINNRFVGNTVIAQDYSAVRTYWAIDPNYAPYATFAESQADEDPYAAGHALNSMFNLLNRQNNLTAYSADAPLYCLENTFDVNNQNQNQTTRIVVKAKYTPKNFASNADFYSIGGNEGLYYLDQTAAEAGYKAWGETYPTEGVTNTVEKVIKGAAVNMLIAAGSDSIFDEANISYITNFGLEAGANDLNGQNKPFIISKVSYYITHNAGEDSEYREYITAAQYQQHAEAQDVVFPDILGTVAVPFTDAEYNNLAAAVGTINKYQAGETYYTAYIRHFDDTEVPALDAEITDDPDDQVDTPEKDVYDNDYQGNEEYYLGRWGMLRNNWYQVTINSISGPGSADIPEREPVPDDNVNYYLSVDVNVLSWAIRQQGVDL